jgi:hypothetical protein
VKAILQSSGILTAETVSRCSAATSATAIALLDLDPTSPSAGSPGNNALIRSGDTNIRANPAAFQFRFPLPVWIHSRAATPRCDNLTSVKSITALLGKIVTRLANKRFFQGNFCKGGTAFLGPVRARAIEPVE